MTDNAIPLSIVPRSFANGSRLAFRQIMIKKLRPRIKTITAGMLLVSIPAVIKHAHLELSEPLIAQQGLYFRASAQAQPDWSQVWLIVQFEGKEGAALSLGPPASVAAGSLSDGAHAGVVFVMYRV